MFQIETDAKAKAGYSTILSRLEPSIIDWTIDNNGQDYLSFKSISGQYHRTGLVGDGVSNLFRIAYALYDFQPGNVLLLDEPELSLHPQGQKRLYREIRACAATGQVVLSTHSPYFVSWMDIQAGARIVRTNLVPGDGALISTLQPSTIQRVAAVAKQKKNRKLYDVVAKEVFFSAGCLFVEGPEDAHIISNYIRRHGEATLKYLGMVPAALRMCRVGLVLLRTFKFEQRRFSTEMRKV
jgi:predicted ATP-dependent endonuclease of OLD family